MLDMSCICLSGAVSALYVFNKKRSQRKDYKLWRG